MTEVDAAALVSVQIIVADGVAYVRVTLRTDAGDIELFRAPAAVTLVHNVRSGAITTYASFPDEWFDAMYSAAVKHMAIRELEKPL